MENFWVNYLIWLGVGVLMLLIFLSIWYVFYSKVLKKIKKSREIPKSIVINNYKNETNEKSFLIRCRAIIFDENNKLLVVKHKPDSDYYALPGGHLEWGENVKECLEREIIEELGVHPQIGRLLYINNFIEEEKNRQSIEFFFEVTNGSDFLKIENLDRSHAYEISDLLWVDSNDSIKILPQKLGESFRQGNILSDTIRYI